MEQELIRGLALLAFVVIAVIGVRAFAPSKPRRLYEWMRFSRAVRRAFKTVRYAFAPRERAFLRYAARTVDLQEALEVRENFERQFADRLDPDEREAAAEMPEFQEMDRLTDNAVENARAALRAYLIRLSDDAIDAIAGHLSQNVTEGEAPAAYFAAFFRAERTLLVEQPHMVMNHLDRMESYVNRLADEDQAGQDG